MSARRVAGRLVLIGAGALAARTALRAVTAQPSAETLQRTNFRGRTVTLAGGPGKANAKDQPAKNS
ncbi:hypothetical protein AB0J06_26105, partial [Micromonospora sp. NPDC049679]